ncbi:Cytochrome c [Durusdinium trenchii]|uniref:Cytochrome c n=1 Tax=Durusdinium trenchii TaxID=1381693 RepID=A0ABP0MAK2_9DINO
MTYTTDGSTPSPTSPRYQAPLTIDRTTTLKIAVLKGNDIAGRVQTVTYRIEPRRQFVARRFIHAVSTPSGRPYEMDDRGLAPGKRQYTDRDYRIVDVPIELQGLPFLRTANNDDRSSGNRWLTMTSDDPVTLFVGVDARNPEPLAWMRVNASDGFQETGLEIVTTDATFRMYRKEFPAGEIVLGGNTNSPTDSGRGNYLVAFERQLLRPDATPATLPDVLAALPEADPERGRELFLHTRGAGCAKCHALEGVGQLLAPDLSDLGNRAKSPEAIVTSILDPSAVITEGFAQQQVATVDGRVLSGAVIEETGLSLKLVTSKGTIHVVRKAEIEARLGTKLSPMPAGFGRMMSATQVADITAWLLTQKVIGDREGFSFKDEQDRLEISYAGQRIATYLKEHEKLTRPAFVNVRTPGGLLVTRNFPPRVPEDIDPGYQGENGIIHPVMHAGIWISYGDLNGNDYWRLQSRVAFDGYVVQPTGTREEGSFTSRHRYLDHTGEKTVCTETVRYQLRKVDAGILLGIEATYLSEEEDFYFGDQEESGLAVRVASPLRVTGGNGTILNNRGERNGTEIWGKPAKWFDYFGVQSGREVGLMVVSSPANPRPSWLHARDYGVVATNPFPKQPKERREPYIKTWVRKGEPYRLSYAVLIHDRPANQPLDREAAAQQALNLLAP